MRELAQPSGRGQNDGFYNVRDQSSKNLSWVCCLVGQEIIELTYYGERAQCAFQRERA